MGQLIPLRADESSNAPDAGLDAAVAERFPREWARANDTRLRNRSKARQQLRRRYRLAVQFDQFRGANPSAACANCEHRHPWSGKLTCDLDTDFEGYAIVEPSSVCVRWASGEGA